ncbi:CoA transferase [Aquamicrobium sp. LC103]|uniref:CaiB/BaiF CoA transferase family protein n=1 Tax=Aquamicrobium sp. LC103 TaxID=1120658 RepID=UPI00063E7E27|nr:CoA transferase [Aquamicrobium sp. LC103]TKT74802.1 CoA transferase [Aquamicrobium sp. LC103]
MGPLSGLKVIDLTAVLMGPYATQFLGDFGADVIKVEPPSGDLVRSIGPGRSPSMGPIFLNANRSKRSIVVNLKTAEGRLLLLDLCREADALVYNIRPAAMARLGLSYEEVSAINPRIIYAGLYGYGQDGRYARRPAYDDLIQGGATLPYLFMLSGSSEPRYVPSAIADRIVGLTALSGILAALLERDRSGRGQRVDVPMFETMVGFILGDHLGGLTFDPPLDAGGYARQLARDRRPFRTADGHVCALVYTDDHWRRFLEAIGQPDLMQTDPRFASFGARMEHVAHVYGWLTELFATRSSAEWIALLDETDIPVMAMHSFETVLEDPHLAEVGFFQRVEHPSEGEIVTMANPVRMSATPVETRRLAPRMGEHTVEVLRELGADEDRISTLLERGIVAAAAQPASQDERG